MTIDILLLEHRNVEWPLSPERLMFWPPGHTSIAGWFLGEAIGQRSLQYWRETTCYFCIPFADLLAKQLAKHRPTGRDQFLSVEFPTTRQQNRISAYSPVKLGSNSWRSLKPKTAVRRPRHQTLDSFGSPSLWLVFLV